MAGGRRPAMGLMCDLPPLFPIAAVAHWVQSPRWSRGPRVEARDGAARETAAIQAERSWTCNRTEETKVNNEQAAPETKGVTVKLLATVDLGPEIEGMAGRRLRMRMVTIEPGGVFGPLHDHKDRPGTVYILQGTITDHRNGVATDYGPGVGWPEDRHTTHWLENRGTIPAVEISVDIVRQEREQA